MINTTIEERISYFRSRNNWSQAQLGEAIEKESGKAVSKDVISNYENGKRKVPSELVPVLAKIFNISTDELFYKPGEGSHLNTIEEVMSTARHTATKDKAAAFDITFEALEKAKEEIQKLKMQVAEYKNEAEKHRQSAEEASLLLAKIGKYTAAYHKNDQGK